LGTVTFVILSIGGENGRGKTGWVAVNLSKKEQNNSKWKRKDFFLTA